MLADEKVQEELKETVVNQQYYENCVKLQEVAIPTFAKMK